MLKGIFIKPHFPLMCWVRASSKCSLKESPWDGISGSFTYIGNKLHFQQKALNAQRICAIHVSSGSPWWIVTVEVPKCTKHDSSLELHLQSNPVHIYSEVSTVTVNGLYAQVRVDRMAASGAFFCPLSCLFPDCPILSPTIHDNATILMEHLLHPMVRRVTRRSGCL